MLTIPTKIIEPGTWRAKWFDFIEKLRYSGLNIKRVRDKIDAAKKELEKSHTNVNLMFPDDKPDMEFPTLDLNNMPEVQTDDKKREYFFFAGDKKIVTNNMGRTYSFPTGTDPDGHPVYYAYIPEHGWTSMVVYGNAAKNIYGMRLVDIIHDKDMYISSKKTLDRMKKVTDTIYKFYKFFRTIDSCYLCIRFPFLYPRNRFNDRHYTNRKVMDYYDSVMDKAMMRKATVLIPKDDTTIPRYMDTAILQVNEREVVDDNKCKTTEYYINYADQEYIVAKKSRWNTRYYPVYIFGALSIFNINEKYFVSIEKADMYVFETLSKNSDYNQCSYDVMLNKPMYIYASIIAFFHRYILEPLHFIPTYSEFDDFPEGWRRAIGMDMLKEIKAQLKKDGNMKSFRITQIKEKFGGLRFYVNSTSRKCYDIISKYESMSYKLCIVCGKPATYISKGWICPYCDEHVGDPDNANKIGQCYDDDDEADECCATQSNESETNS